MSRRASKAAFQRMLIWGAGCWTLIFVIAVFTVAIPYIERWGVSGYTPPTWQIVMPTLVAGLVLIGAWIGLIALWWPRRAWLVYLVASLGGFMTMVLTVVFVAMPDVVWQLVSSVGISVALVIAVRTGRSTRPE